MQTPLKKCALNRRKLNHWMAPYWGHKRLLRWPLRPIWAVISNYSISSSMHKAIDEDIIIPILVLIHRNNIPINSSNYTPPPRPLSSPPPAALPAAVQHRSSTRSITRSSLLMRQKLPLQQPEQLFPAVLPAPKVVVLAVVALQSPIALMMMMAK